MRLIKHITILFSAIIVFAGPLFGQQTSKIRTVVIDPGHGGKDPGCHGVFSNEKSVVLAIGLKLGEYIKNRYPDINVIYTRKTDVFIELEERARIANSNNADVFISIHANSASPSAYGVETYALGLHRTESQKNVAMRENSTLLFEEGGLEKYKDFELSPDAIIARQLQLSVFLDQSISLASKVQMHFTNDNRRDRGVRQAGFLVLYRTTMPSILIEVGFLTNKEEEKLLNGTANQARAANAIFKAFQEYVAEIEGVNALIVDGKGYLASQEDSSPDNKEEKDKVYFKIQIVATEENIPLTDTRFKNLPVDKYEQNGFFKYTAGLFMGDFESANAYKKEMKDLGFKDAFVIGFLNGERIPITEAMKMSQK